MNPLILALAFYVNLLNQGTTSPQVIKDFIGTEATIAGVYPPLAIGIAEAESRLNPNAVGDKGTSFSLFQIHLPAHKDITEAEAKNIIFNVEWSMNEMKQKGCSAWSTCTDVENSLNYQSDANLSLTDGT